MQQVEDFIPGLRGHKKGNRVLGSGNPRIRNDHTLTRQERTVEERVVTRPDNVVGGQGLDRVDSAGAFELDAGYFGSRCGGGIQNGRGVVWRQIFVSKYENPGEVESVHDLNVVGSVESCYIAPS